MSKTYVETSAYLLEEIDEMVREGFYTSRTEAVNDALRELLKRYKVSKLHAKDMRAGKDQQERKEQTP
jgi:Arc/MetJ-type ribon-helix-helix transcriptional regulator